MTPSIETVSEEQLNHLIDVAEQLANDGVLLAFPDGERMWRHLTVAALRELRQMRGEEIAARKFETLYKAAGKAIEEIAAERDSLRARVVKLEKLRDELTAFYAGAVRDAARYRWLKTPRVADVVFAQHVKYHNGQQSIETRYPLVSELDLAIDAALSNEKREGQK